MTKINNDRTTLGFLGKDFQFKLVKVFIEDHRFFMEIQHIVDQNMFTEEGLRRIVGFMKERYCFNETVPSYSELEILIRSKIADTINLELTLGVLKSLENFNLIGMDLVKSESEKFFKQQNLVKAINKANDIIKKGDTSQYYAIEDIIRDAINTNTKQDMGYRVFDNMEEALSDDYRNAIPTGAKKLDEMLFGGLGKGELGVIIAPSGVGKTSATTGFAAYAATYKCQANNFRGYKVLHVHFEDKEKDIKRKYYGYITNTDACDLSKPDIRPKIIEIINNNNAELKNMIQNNIICLHPQSGEFSVSELKNKVKQLIAKGFKPDLIIADYFECFKLEPADTTGDKEFTREGKTMRKLETIAHEFDAAVWCPIQGTKDSIGAEFVGMDKGGGSVKKVQIGHVIVTFAKTVEQARRGRMTVTLLKFRGGRIDNGMLQDIEFNNGTCHFNTEPSDYTIDEISSNDIFGSTANKIAHQIKTSW